MTCVSFSEAEWRQFLKPERRPPNLLVICPSHDVEPVVTRMMTLCAGPVHVSVLPGKLCLPEERLGTVLLSDVAQLTHGQQVELQDWMTDRPASPQVISITSTPLLPLVEDGRFLEGLFYRINVISLAARIGDSSEEESRGDEGYLHQKAEQIVGGRGSRLPSA